LLTKGIGVFLKKKYSGGKAPPPAPPPKGEKPNGKKHKKNKGPNPLAYRWWVKKRTFGVLENQNHRTGSPQEKFFKPGGVGVPSPTKEINPRGFGGDRRGPGFYRPPCFKGPFWRKKQKKFQ